MSSKLEWAVAMVASGAPALVVSFLTDDPTILFATLVGCWLVPLVFLAPFVPWIVKDWREDRRQRRLEKLDWV